MATIYAKPTGSTTNSVVLDSREMLVQNFFLGDTRSDNWTDLRVGMFYSLTSTSQLNGLYTREQISYTTPNDGFFFGLTSTGQYTLLGSGATYIGIASSPTSGVGTTTLSTGILNGYQGQLYPLVASGYSGVSAGAFNGVYPATPATATGNSSFASFLGMRVVITGLATNGQSAQITIDNGTSGVGINDISISALRSRLEQFQNPMTSDFVYYTKDLVNGGDPLPLPRSVIAYFPFLNNRLRVHALVVQRYQPLT